MTHIDKPTEASTVVAINYARRTVKLTGRADWVRWYAEPFSEKPPLPFHGDMVWVNKTSAFPMNYEPPSWLPSWEVWGVV